MGTCFKTYQMHPRLQRIFFSPLSNSLGAGVLGSLFCFCGVPEKALIQPFSLRDSILSLNFELIRKTDVTNWKTSLESHHFDVLQTLNLSQFLCWTKYSRCFLPSGFFCVFLSKKEFLSPKLRQRTYWQWQNDRTCGLQASFSWHVNLQQEAFMHRQPSNILYTKRFSPNVLLFHCHCDARKLNKHSIQSFFLQ